VLGVAVGGVGAGQQVDCWVRVGMPVDGRRGCTSMITAGTSAKEASPMKLGISEMPDPTCW